MPITSETDWNQVWVGNNINLDCTGLQFTDALVTALRILDNQCSSANGKFTYDISLSEELGVEFEAQPSGPFDQLYFYDGAWHDTLPEDEETEEEDMHAEDCDCEFCQP